MNIWDADKLILFIAFFIPGFISIKVYDIFIPSEKKNAQNTILDAVTYSCINYALLSWLLYIDIRFAFQQKLPLVHSLILLLVLFVSPVLLAFFYMWLRKTKIVREYIPHPIQKPWDYFFGKQESYWVIIELNDGTKIGGIYDSDSFASSFPAEEQIYLQQVWEIEDRKFIKPIERSRGIIVSGGNIKHIEFFT